MKNTKKIKISPTELLVESIAKFGSEIFSKRDVKTLVIERFGLSEDSARNRVSDILDRLPIKLIAKDLYRLDFGTLAPLGIPSPTPSQEPVITEKKKADKETVEKDSKKDELAITAREILEHLNKATNSNFKASQKNLAHIMARLRDGYTKEDCILVIDKKTKEWLGTSFEKFLRVSTLFAGKFDDYLNQKYSPNSNVEKMANYDFSKYVKGEI